MALGGGSKPRSLFLEGDFKLRKYPPACRPLVEEWRSPESVESWTLDVERWTFLRTHGDKAAPSDNIVSAPATDLRVHLGRAGAAGVGVGGGGLL
jgi:hypothetical protein